MAKIVLGAVYVNRSGQRLKLYHVNFYAGAVNARVQAHNWTTGYDEEWSLRLFLAEHTREDGGDHAATWKAIESGDVRAIVAALEKGRAS